MFPEAAPTEICSRWFLAHGAVVAMVSPEVGTVAAALGQARGREQASV